MENNWIITNTTQSIENITHNNTIVTSTTEETDQSECFYYDFLMNFLFKVVVMVLGCHGNMLSFLVMWSERNKSATAFLLLALSVVDSLLLIGWVFITTFPSKDFQHSITCFWPKEKII